MFQKYSGTLWVNVKKIKLAIYYKGLMLCPALLIFIGYIAVIYITDFYNIARK